MRSLHTAYVQAAKAEAEGGGAGYFGTCPVLRAEKNTLDKCPLIFRAWHSNTKCLSGPAGNGCD